MACYFGVLNFCVHAQSKHCASPACQLNGFLVYTSFIALEIQKLEILKYVKILC